MTVRNDASLLRPAVPSSALLVTTFARFLLEVALVKVTHDPMVADAKAHTELVVARSNGKAVAFLAADASTCRRSARCAHRLSGRRRQQCDKARVQEGHGRLFPPAKRSMSLILRIPVGTLARLRDNHGTSLDEVLEIHYGKATQPEHLTESEGRALIARGSKDAHPRGIAGPERSLQKGWGANAGAFPAASHRTSQSVGCSGLGC